MKKGQARDIGSLLLIIIGVIAIGAGVLGGIYLGLVKCFIGGIIQVVNSVTNVDGVSASGIAWGVVRMLVAGFVGYGTGAVGVILGTCCIKAAE